MTVIKSKSEDVQPGLGIPPVEVRVRETTTPTATESPERRWLNKLKRIATDKGWEFGQALADVSKLVALTPIPVKEGESFLSPQYIEQSKKGLRSKEDRRLMKLAAEETGLTSGSLRQYRLTAERFPVQHRIEGASYSHHLAVAFIFQPAAKGAPKVHDLVQAQALLRQAVAEEWPVSKLYAKVKGPKPAKEHSTKATKKPEVQMTFGEATVSAKRVLIEQTKDMTRPEAKKIVLRFLDVFRAEVEQW